MAIDILRMEGSQYPSHYGTGAGYGVFYDPYARQTQMPPALRGPPLHSRQAHGFFGGYGRPHNSFKPMGFPQGGGSKRKFEATFNQAPQGQGQPLLHQLRADNLKKTRRHFQGSFESAASTPRIAPRAPDNRHGFLLSAGSGVLLPSPGSQAQGALHIITPSAVPGGEAQLWKNSYGNADKEAVQLAAAAGLDFLGSFYDDGATASVDEDCNTANQDFDADGKGLVGADTHDPAEQPPNTFDEEASFPPQAKRKLASQAAYIAQLEEQQLTLRERIFLLEQQLADARRQQQAEASPPSGQSGDVDDASDEDRATSSS